MGCNLAAIVAVAEDGEKLISKVKNNIYAEFTSRGVFEFARVLFVEIFYKVNLKLRNIIRTYWYNRSCCATSY